MTIVHATGIRLYVVKAVIAVRYMSVDSQYILVRMFVVSVVHMFDSNASVRRTANVLHVQIRSQIDRKTPHNNKIFVE